MTHLNVKIISKHTNGNLEKISLQKYTSPFHEDPPILHTHLFSNLSNLTTPSSPPHFMKTSSILHTPFFSNFVQPQLSPCYPLPATSTPTTLFVVLFLWLNGWLCQIMDLHTLSLDTLVPEGYCYVFYATRHQVYWSLTHNVVFLLLLYLISQTQTQTHTHTDSALRGQ